MKLTHRLRSNVWLPSSLLFVLWTSSAIGNPIFRSTEMDDVTSINSAFTAAETSDEMLVTSSMALSRAAIAELITDKSGAAPSLRELLQPPDSADHNDCLVTGTGATFSVCFGVPSLLPLGHYYFIPRVSVANGEFYWYFESKPVSMATSNTSSAQIQTPGLQP